MVHPIVKKHFLKYGLPASVLQQISNLVTGSLDENATEDEVLQSAKTYEDFAKSFQSELDSKLARARKDVSVEDEEPLEAPDNGGKKPDGKPSNKMLEMMEKLFEKVSNLESDKLNQSLLSKATDRLKSIKMSEAEVNAALYGRKFENDEQVEDFVSRQEEFYEEILKNRTEDVIGAGGRPPASQGQPSKQALTSEIESFNERY